MSERSPSPAIRGAYLRDNYAVVERLGPGVAALVNERLHDDTRAALAAVRPDDWAPVQLDVAVTHAIYEALGEPGLRRANREVFLAAVEGPMLKPIFAGLQRMFGITPLALLRLGPRLWNTIYRDCGDLSLEQHDGGNAVVLDRAPDVLLTTPSYFVGVAGVIDACFVLARRNGSVAITVDAAERRVRWRVAWD